MIIIVNIFAIVFAVQYDGDETAKEIVPVKMFCIRDCYDRSTRIQQVGVHSFSNKTDCVLLSMYVLKKEPKHIF